MSVLRLGSLKYSMATTEELLQELISLQKEEMRRTRLQRRLHFYFSTLPTIIIIVLSILSLWGLYEASINALDHLSELDSGDIFDYFKN